MKQIKKNMSEKMDLTVVNKMNIKNIFDKIYSRDTIPFMKPYYKSYQLSNPY